MKTLDNYVNINQAAILLNCNRTWVNRLILTGRLQAERYGRDWLIDRESIELYKTTKRKPGNPNFPQPEPK